MIGREFLNILDGDGDGKVSIEEYTQVFDADGDGVVSAKEEAMARSLMLDETQQIPGSALPPARPRGSPWSGAHIRDSLQFGIALTCGCRRCRVHWTRRRRKKAGGPWCRSIPGVPWRHERHRQLYLLEHLPRRHGTPRRNGEPIELLILPDCAFLCRLSPPRPAPQMSESKRTMKVVAEKTWGARQQGYTGYKADQSFHTVGRRPSAALRARHAPGGGNATNGSSHTGAPPSTRRPKARTRM
jgi:hypothetical protein